MKRTLLLDEDDLIMVVKEDVVKQIDEQRGEMNRTEFVNYLIQCQLKGQRDRENYVDKDELRAFMYRIMDVLNSFLQFFVSYGMLLGKDSPGEELQAIGRKLDSFMEEEDTREQ